MHETRPLAEQRRKGSLFRSSPLLLRSISQTLQVLDLVFVLGEGARQDLIQRWAPRAAVEIIPHGDEGIFLPEGEIPGVATTEQSVLFFGTWIRHKGIDVLLDAFELLRPSMPDATLTIAGAVAGDVDLASVRARASQVGNVILRPGYVNVDDVPGLFGRARVVAVPYLRANQSGVVHLAQTFGRPVVATDVGDIPAVVRDGIDGYVVPPGDVPALAAGLRTLLLDPMEADRLGRQGRQRVISAGSWDDIARRVTAAVERVAQRSSR
jgi:glycosyltransferase involved in cell wall biosynthesis